MNAREQANQAMAKMRLTSDGILLNDMALNFLEAHKLLFTEAIEQAIIAAIEADRKSRECCKAGRDKAIKEIVEIINDVDIHTRKEILEEIDKIRARS